MTNSLESEAAVNSAPVFAYSGRPKIPSLAAAVPKIDGTISLGHSEGTAASELSVKTDMLVYPSAGIVCSSYKDYLHPCCLKPLQGSRFIK